MKLKTENGSTVKEKEKKKQSFGLPHFTRLFKKSRPWGAVIGIGSMIIGTVFGGIFAYSVTPQLREEKEQRQQLATTIEQDKEERDIFMNDIKDALLKLKIQELQIGQLAREINQTNIILHVIDRKVGQLEGAVKQLIEIQRRELK